MTYSDTIDFLYGIRLFGQKLGLETMQYLLRLMGDPQRSLRFIHIAGTNGKGSVAAMLHAALSAAGYHTGLYTSPHLVSFCERFQINGRPVAESDIVRLVEDIKPLLAKVGADPEFRSPTFFEAVTAIALHYFHERKVDVVVWETGLGGRLDATNVVTPLVSVITNVAFDHTQYLGETLSQIAVEKCGIIKNGVPVVTAAGAEEALAVVRRTVAERACRLTVVGEHVRATRLGEDEHCQGVRLDGTRREYGALTIPLLGPHQALNCATAVAALEASGLDVAPAQVGEGLGRTRWPGRFEIVGHDPTVVLDGAHNAAASEKLALTLREHFAGRKLTLIIGVLRDKNYDQMCSILAPLAGRIFCVPVNSERTSDPDQLARWCKAANPAAHVSVDPNVSEAYPRARAAGGGSVIVITGSLFLVGEALDRLGFAHAPTATTPKELVLQ
ncbi:MAG TPA: folylpolyglutamate synthase/dihydrofolate synthase family protein [Verrucomicrobiae bacterium]|nr:folylpolyglutamate synthase/dihydrofolate synthase family protein [Verrucomicrobiae bacterium]